MADATDQERRLFVSYPGVRLPFNLVNPIAADALGDRNTFVRAHFDKAGILTGFDKVVYGEVELTHRYQYDGSGALQRAAIAMPDDYAVLLAFGEAGAQIQAHRMPHRRGLQNRLGS